MTNIQSWSNDDKRDVIRYLLVNSYRSERLRLLYVSTPKVACTKLKWWFADLEGFAESIRKNTDNSIESSPDLVIHDSIQKFAPLTEEDICEALESDSFFIFSLVRNPYKRIFSAWQSKLLLQEPIQSKPYIDKDFFHHPVETADDVAHAFEAFLEYLAENESPSFCDLHWTPQAVLLRPDLIDYSCITKIEERENLTGRLRDWLGVRIPSPFEGNVLNDSLIPYMPELITQRSAELICSMYSHDFDVFCYDKQIPTGKEGLSSEQFDVALKAVKHIRARLQRFGERNELIGRLNCTLVERDRQIASLTQAVSERDRQIASLTQAVSERDGQIAALNQSLTERDTKIAALNTQISGLLQSRSWRLTKPLRAVAGGMRSLRGAFKSDK